MPESFQLYLNNQREDFSSVFEELSQRQFRKNEVFSALTEPYALLIS